MIKSQSDRQNYIDWLRVGAMFLLLFFHTGRLFDADIWHIKSASFNQAIDMFNSFLSIWHMPLFFILAGASVWFALNSRTPGAFTKERILRLWVPLVFGILIIVPPQVYYERIFDGDFAGSFLAWYPHTFQGMYSDGNAATGNLSWHHLWFMAYLFVFSLVLIPAFRYFKNEKRKSLISRMTDFLEKPGAIFLPAIPLIVYNIVLIPIFGWGSHNLVSDWATFMFYITVFFYGFLLVADGRIIQIVRRNRHIALTAAAVLTLGLALTDSGIVTISGSLTSILWAAACWCWLVFIIGAGSLLLNFSNKVLKYASDAVLPVYILHQTLIVVMGYYIIRWDTGVAPQYFLIVAATLAGSLAIYEVVKRMGMTRFLFGIKTKKQPVPARVLVPQVQEVKVSI